MSFLVTIAVLLSLVALVRPMPRIWLPTRGRAAAVLVGALFLGSIFSAEENTGQQKTVQQAAAKQEPKGQQTSAPARHVPEPEPTVSKITFTEVHNKFGAESSSTDLQKDEAWKDYKGKCVEWRGELAYLDEGFFGGLSVGFKHLPYTLTYDVLVSAPKSEKANLLKWREGTRYTYKATLRSYGTILPISADWGCE